MCRTASERFFGCNDILIDLCEYLSFRDIRNFAFLSKTTDSAASTRLYKLGARCPGALMYTVSHGHIRAMRSLLDEGSRVDSKLLVLIPYDLLWQKVVSLYSFGHYGDDCERVISKIQPHSSIDASMLARFGPSTLTPQSAFSSPHVVLPVLCSKQELISLASTRSRDGQAMHETNATPLHVAALRGDLDMIHELLKRGANTETCCRGLCACSGINTYGSKFGGWYPIVWTPLHLAICHRQVEAAKLLLEKGVSVQVSGCYAVTALHTAAATGQVDLMRFITDNRFQDNVDIRDATTYSGNTPLRYAFTNGHWATAATWLISKGADINKLFNSPSSVTMLAVSARAGRLDEVVQLLKLGADPSSIVSKRRDQESHGRMSIPGWKDRPQTTLMQLLSYGVLLPMERERQFSWLVNSRYQMSYDPSGTRLPWAVDLGDPNLTKLIQLIYPISLPDGGRYQMNCMPPLTIACGRRGFARFVQILLETGADPNERLQSDRGGIYAEHPTPLLVYMRECRQGYERHGGQFFYDDKTVVKLLIEHGARVNQDRDEYLWLLDSMVRCAGGYPNPRVKAEFQALLTELKCDFDVLGPYAVKS